MKKLLPIAVAATLVLAVGVAWANTGTDDGQPAATTMDTTRVAAAVAPAAGESTTAGAGRAGAVTYTRSGETLHVDSVSPAARWSYTVKSSEGRQVEVTFRKASTRIDFTAEVEDGHVEIRVRTRTVAGTSTTTAADRGGSPSTTSAGPSGTSVTSTSWDDNGGDRGDGASDDPPGDDNGGDRGDGASDDPPGDDNGGDRGHGGDDDHGDDSGGDRGGDDD